MAAHSLRRNEETQGKAKLHVACRLNFHATPSLPVTHAVCHTRTHVCLGGTIQNATIQKLYTALARHVAVGNACQHTNMLSFHPPVIQK